MLAGIHMLQAISLRKVDETSSRVHRRPHERYQIYEDVGQFLRKRPIWYALIASFAFHLSVSLRCVLYTSLTPTFLALSGPAVIEQTQSQEPIFRGMHIARFSRFFREFVIHVYVSLKPALLLVEW